MGNINPSVAIGSGTAHSKINRLCQSNIVCLFILCFANRADIYNTANIRTFVCEMDTSARLPVIASSAKGNLIGVEINSAQGNGKGVVDVLLPLAFQLQVFILQCSECDLQIRKLHFQIGNFKHKLGISQALCQFSKCAGFRTKGLNEVWHS